MEDLEKSPHIAKASDFAEIRVSDNCQYFIGGDDLLKQSSKLVGLLAQQNELEVQYEVEGEEFAEADGSCRIKACVGEERFFGAGKTLSQAKQAAAMHLLTKTKHKFDELPPMLNAAPSKSKDDNKRSASASPEQPESKKMHVDTKSDSSGKERPDNDADIEDMLCIATIWDFAGKIQVANNGQYLVGGKEVIKESKKLMGILSKQNKIDVQYEAVDDELPLEEGQMMLKVVLGDEMYFGSGDSVDEAKQAASLQVLMKTNYTFESIPAMLTPAPKSVKAGAVITQYPTELDGVSIHLRKSAKRKAATVTPTPTSKEDEKKEPEKQKKPDGIIADNGQYYVEGETVERQCQYLISTMASQNKIPHKYDIIEKCKSSSWVNWVAIRLTLGKEMFNASGESEAEAKKTAALKALQKTHYKFTSQFLPAGLRPTPQQKSNELDNLEQGIQKLRRAAEEPESVMLAKTANPSPAVQAYLAELEAEKELALMLSGVESKADSGQILIDAFARKASRYLTARLASQNKISLRYDVLGEKFKPEAKRCRVRLRIKNEEFTGSGKTVKLAKKHVTLKALKKTKLTFHTLPKNVKLLPEWDKPVKVEGENGVDPKKEKESEEEMEEVKEEPEEGEIDEAQEMDRTFEEGEIEDEEMETAKNNDSEKTNIPKKEPDSFKYLTLADLGLPTSFSSASGR